MELDNVLSQPRADLRYASRIEADFDHSDVAGGSVVIGNVPGGKRVQHCDLQIDVAFDGGTTITVGDATAQGRIMTATDNDPGFVARYHEEPDHEYLTTTELRVWFPSGAPTVGSGTAVLYLA